MITREQIEKIIEESYSNYPKFLSSTIEKIEIRFEIILIEGEYSTTPEFISIKKNVMQTLKMAAIIPNNVIVFSFIF